MRVVVLFAVLLGIASGPVTAAEPLAALRQYFESVQTLRGDFVQETRDERGNLVERTSGDFAIARPNRFDWVYETPYEQRIVADGEWLWVYDVELAQVSVRPLDEVLGVGPAVLLSGDYAALEESFAIAAGENDWIRLEPQSGQWDFQQVRLRMSGGVPVEVEVNDGLGQVTRLRLKALERNVELDSQRFRFQVPDGVDLIAPPGFERQN